MGRWASLISFSSLFLSGPAASQAILDDMKALSPYSETAIAVTGPVLISTARMVFETGEVLDLDVVDPVASGSWGASGNVTVAQVIRVSGDVGALRQQNTLCGDQPVTYLAAWEEESSGSKYIGIAMFTGMEIPIGVDAEGICGTYFYSTDVRN